MLLLVVVVLLLFLFYAWSTLLYCPDSGALFSSPRPWITSSSPAERRPTKQHLETVWIHFKTISRWELNINTESRALVCHQMV